MRADSASPPSSFMLASIFLSWLGDCDAAGPLKAAPKAVEGLGRQAEAPAPTCHRNGCEYKLVVSRVGTSGGDNMEQLRERRRAPIRRISVDVAGAKPALV